MLIHDSSILLQRVGIYTSAKSRSMRNSILELKVCEVWIEGVYKIRHQMVNYFIEIFT